MDLWQWLVLLLANCLVSALVGWVAAHLRYSLLAYQVSSMEAAVTTYWDRIRKRMRIEQTDGQQQPAAQPRKRGVFPLPPELQMRGRAQ